MVTLEFAYTSLTGSDVTATTSLVSTNTDASRTIFIDDEVDNTMKLYVYLYSDNAWDTWVAAINASDHVTTENEKVYMDEYSSYSIRMYCNITVIGGLTSTDSKTSSGCCLRDLS